MKKLLLAMACALPMASTNAEFQLRKVLICDEKNKILESLSENFQESPVWTGFSPNQSTNVILTENAETGAWTLIELINPDVVCVMAVGEGSRHKQTDTIKNKFTT